MHGFRCYDNIAPNAKCQRVLILLCLVLLSVTAELVCDERVFTKVIGIGEIAAEVNKRYIFACRVVEVACRNVIVCTDIGHCFTFT